MGPTFTVELLSFPGVNTEVAAARLAGAFQLPLEQAVSYVAAAPVKIKSGANPELTQLYMRSLLLCGAQLRVTNEQSGEKVVYNRHSAEAAEEPPADAPVPTVKHTEAGVHESVSKVFCPKCGWTMATGEPCSHCGASFEFENTTEFAEVDSDIRIAGLRQYLEEREKVRQSLTDSDDDDVIDIPPPPGMDKVKAEDAATLIRKASGEQAAVRKPYRVGEAPKSNWLRLVILVILLAALAVVMLTTSSGSRGIGPEDLPDGVERPSRVPPEFRLIPD